MRLASIIGALFPENVKVGCDLYIMGRAAKSLKKLDTSVPLRQRPYIAPGQDGANHYGFVNCKNNAKGLQAEFFQEPNDVVACVWDRAERSYEGYPHTIHGGILSSLLDELMANSIVSSQGRFGATLSQRLYFHAAAKVEDKVYGRSQVDWSRKNLRRCRAYLFNDVGRVCCTAAGIFLLPTAAQFRRIARTDEIPSELLPYFGS